MLGPMTRRDQQPRREEKRARLQAERVMSGQVGAYTPPPRTSCRQKSWYQAMDDADTIGLRDSSCQCGRLHRPDHAVSCTGGVRWIGSPR